ncbi:Deoxycytidine monophosphate (dCMP) deaminase [Neophaeococcomyces mojaviensis]|uniref:Deoxycytidine monophosphate (dCMP) deaminase n=1 Tax=Neophaeococcomyces mojaviensis TaxID=3383035 RepID=A0ACC3A0A7_9EURO|nr:Deoxycytidine monophosphate (dCMP) deaminase [Knufia sp. JES_112]
MLVGICGTICSGKHTTAEYLVQHHGFLRLHLPKTTHSPSKQNNTDKHFLPSVTDERGTRGLTFPDVDSLLEFVTKRWQEHWVLTDIEDEDTLELLLRRPFFLLLSVDAPVTLRFRRFNARCTKRDLSSISLEDFVDADDQLLYGSSESGTIKGTAPLHSRAHIQILNSYTSISSYFQFLDTLDLPSESRLRPPWDTYFMHLAHLASLRSNCMKRRVGCVLIHNNRIISTGYNGTPRGIKNCNAGGCPRCNSGSSGGAALSTCLCLHAEENALLEAGRERIREGAVLYCDTCPCLTCSVKIAQVGVREVVYSQTYNMDESSRKVLAEAGVKLRQYSPPGKGLLGPHTDAVNADSNIENQLVVRNGT